jgi:hypothetical protein
MIIYGPTLLLVKTLSFNILAARITAIVFPMPGAPIRAGMSLFYS